MLKRGIQVATSTNCIAAVELSKPLISGKVTRKDRTAPTSAIQQNAEPLRIGIDWDWGCPMHGVIDEVRISRVPRYSGSFTPSTTHTVDADTMALYTFDAYTGSTLYDRSGNGNHGTIDGASWTTSNAP